VHKSFTEISVYMDTLVGAVVVVIKW